MAYAADRISSDRGPRAPMARGNRISGSGQIVALPRSYGFWA